MARTHVVDVSLEWKAYSPSSLPSSMGSLVDLEGLEPSTSYMKACLEGESR